jgi:hypothetical protein
MRFVRFRSADAGPRGITSAYSVWSTPSRCRAAWRRTRKASAVRTTIGTTPTTPIPARSTSRCTTMTSTRHCRLVQGIGRTPHRACRWLPRNPRQSRGAMPAGRIGAPGQSHLRERQPSRRSARIASRSTSGFCSSVSSLSAATSYVRLTCWDGYAYGPRRRSRLRLRAVPVSWPARSWSSRAEASCPEACRRSLLVG